MKKIFIFLFLMFAPVVFAETNEDYAIDNLRVSRIDKDATTAREKAIIKGQRDAFNIVLARLSIDDSNGVIITDDEISQMLRSMQIRNEKITDNSYSATLTLEFSPDYVKYTLNKHRITKFSTAFDSYLIVPVLNENGNTYLWERSNRWTNFFNKNVKSSEGVFLVNSDFASKNLIDLDYFKKPKFSNFKNLADLYGVNNVVAVVGNYQANGNTIYTKIYVMSDKKIRNATLNYEMQNINNPDIDFNDASLKIIEYLDGLRNKSETQYAAAPQIQRDGIYVFAPISSLKDFNNVDKILKNDKNVITATLKSLEKNLAIYFVKYENNDITSLISSLESDGFTISEKKNGLYIFI